MADSSLIWVPNPNSDEECFFRAALGTTLPTEATDVLDPDFWGHGWVDEDGIENAIKRNVTKHKAFGGNVVRTTQDDYEETIKVTFLESNPAVWETVYGTDNVTTDYSAGHRKTTIRHSSDQLERSSFVVRVVDGDRTRMLVVPEGQVTEIDTIKIDHKTLWMYTVTIDCFKPATGTQPDNPEAVNEYLDEPDVVSGS